MRVAFFSPLPPCRSGIADYSETLVEHLKPLVDLEVFADGDRPFAPSRFDIPLYPLGNNPHHGFVYEAALRQPGVVVMHESNLHHLVADLTIRRNDWDAYLRACEYEGGPEALAYARRVRALEAGPDYEGLDRKSTRLRALSIYLTIRRNDWDASLRACEYEGGPEALAYARRVRALEVGPDYEGLRDPKSLL